MISVQQVGIKTKYLCTMVLTISTVRDEQEHYESGEATDAFSSIRKEFSSARRIEPLAG